MYIDRTVGSRRPATQPRYATRAPDRDLFLKVEA